ncbi:MAG: hypothetical protein HYV35_02860 [Lentisphaerae bacterium]|nr:hypothetical protein [Lentisphaerota bacterium]
MKVVIDALIVVAALSLIAGIISHWQMTPLCYGLQARSFLGFSAVCLLFAISLGVRALARK